MKFSPWIFTIMLAQASLVLYVENSWLRKETRLHGAAEDILRDQISDLESTVSRLVSERDFVATQNYVSGAVRAMSEPDRFGEVWHDGYNKGLEQSRYTNDH